jgi:hypothetical protein
LIVSRPEGVEGLCVEASLETGHYKEDTVITEPPLEYEESHEEFVVSADSTKPIEEHLISKHTIESGWIINRTKGDTFHSGIQFLGGEDEEGIIDTGNVTERIHIFNYQAVDDSTVQVTGDMQKRDNSKNRHGKLKFRVFTRREQPMKHRQEATADTGRLLITNRSLCACFKSGKCLEIVPPPVPPVEPPPYVEHIVDEPVLKINKALLTREASSQTRMPAMKEFLQKMQTALTTSFRSPKRYAFGEVGFLESDYFRDQIKQLLPEQYLKIPISRVKGLPREVVKALGDDNTIEQALSIDLARFARRTGLSIEDASKVRHQLLGIAQPSNNDKTDTGSKENYQE